MKEKMGERGGEIHLEEEAVPWLFTVFVQSGMKEAYV